MDSSASEGSAADASPGPRRQNRWLDEDALLSSEDDGRHRGRGRGGRGGRGRGLKKAGGEVQGTASKEVVFVRGAAQHATTLPPAKEKTKRARSRSADSGSSVDSRFRLDATAPKPGAEIGPKRPSRNAMSEGQMASSYGKGFAMLKKMGFAGGGLGARNDGIANPIEVFKRKNRQGLQDEGEAVGQDLFGTENLGGRPFVEEFLAPRQGGGGKVPASNTGWKKGDGAKRPKTQYKTAAQVANDAGHVRIRDLRGPDERVVASFSELAASLNGDAVSSLKELRHNVRKLVAKYEDTIRSVAEKKRYFETVILTTSREKEGLASISQPTEHDMSLCQELVSQLEVLRTRQDDASLTLQELGMEAGRLQTEYPKSFRTLNAAEVVLALAVPVARLELESWHPLKEAKSCCDALAPWQQLKDGMGAKATAVLCEQVVLPRLRTALCEWSPRDVEPCVALVGHIDASLPPHVRDAVVAQIILPRLSAEVESWSPRTDTVPIHLWIHPWLPLLGSQLRILWPTIRFKLSASLERWSPSDRSAHGVLKPWQQVFTPADWEPLVEKVLGRFQSCIESMDVKPDGQDLGPLRDLAMWTDLLPVDGLARILDLSFFPQWHDALRRWLRHSGCNYSEVMRWYQMWRAVLPEALQHQPIVQQHFANGLKFMRHRMTGGVDADEPEPPTAPLPQGRAAASEVRSEPQLKIQREDIGFNLLDELAMLAGEKGIIFRPTQKLHGGRPVYKFGDSSAIVDRGEVHAAPRGGAWRRVSADELVALAQLDSSRHS